MSSLAVAPAVGTARPLRVDWTDPYAPRLLFAPRGANGEVLDLGFPVRPALCIARLEAESCRHIGRAFVHDVNGKAMGIGCIVSSAGLVDLGRLSAADAALVDEALHELRDLAALQTTLLRPNGPALAQLSAPRLAEALPKLLISCFRRHRAVETSGTGDGEPLPSWAIRLATALAASAAHAFDRLEPVGQPFRLRLHWSPSLRVVSLEFRVARWAEADPDTPPEPDAAAARDLILACGTLASSASTPGNDVLQFDFREPDPSVTTLVVGDVPGVSPGADQLRIPDDPHSLELAVLRHAATLETVHADASVPGETAERIDGLARLFGLHAIHG